MVCTESVLHLAVVDCDLDGDGSIDETDDCGGNADEVGVSSIRCASKLGGYFGIAGETTSSARDSHLFPR